MRRAIPFFFFLLISANLFSQTNIPNGTVSGTWTAAGSPYLVQGNIMIANGTTLTIQPGVTVSFQGSYRLLVNGRLIAAGTGADSIRFTAVDTSTGWQGIRFDNTSINNDSSVISYCSIQYGISTTVNGGGIYVRNFPKLSIRNTTISNCWAVGGKGGGGIYLEGSNIIFRDNKIFRNHAVSGGGMYISGGSPLVTNNVFSYNDNRQPPPAIGDPGSDPDSYGGGIHIWNSEGATVSSNTITYNSCLYGGGLAQQYGTAFITNNNISYNQANSGGGIYANDGGQFRTNTISYNTAGTDGGAVYCAGGSGFENNNIIYNTAAKAGGGFMITFGTSNIIHNLIANNNLTSTPDNDLQGGGGVCVNGGSTFVLMRGNVIVNNTGVKGGGLFIYGGFETMVNNTIANNTAQKGGGMYLINAGSLELLNTIIWGNTASETGQQIILSDDVSDPSIRYSDIMGGQAAIELNGNFYTGVYEDNIDADPLFINPSSGTGHLFDGVTVGWALSINSPAIDAGQPNNNVGPTDFAGNIRVVNGRIDIGAFEDQATVPPTATVSGGGIVCPGTTRPTVVFNFTLGTFPFTLVFSINGVPQTPVTGINTLQYSITNAAPGTYAVVSITDPFTSGTTSGSATVTVEQPVAGFTVNKTTQCVAGNLFVFTDTSRLNTSSNITSWSWNFGDGATDSIANPSHTYSNAGNYTVRLTIVTSAGCTSSITRTVSVQSFSINPFPDTIRIYSDSFLLNAGSGYTRYLWNNGDSTNITTVKTTGKYKVTVTNSTGCTASDSVYVEFRKLKTLFIDRVQNLCTVSSFPLSVKAKSLTNIIGLQGTIRWTSAVMTLDSVSFTNAAINITAANVNLSNIGSGYITYSWNDNTLTGKTVADSTELFTLWFTKPGATSATTQTVSFSSNPTAMEIDSINLSNNTPVLVTETSYINGSAGFRSRAASTSIQLADCDSVTYNNQVYFQNTQLFDTVKYAGSYCDSVIKNVTITVYDTIVQPSITISASNTNIINGNTVTFTATTGFGGSNPLIQWYKNGVLIPGQTGVQFTTNTLSGGDTVYAVLKSSFSCVSDSFTVSNPLVISVRYNVTGTIRGPQGAGTRQPSVSITGSGNSTVTTNGSGFYSTLLTGGPARNYVLKPFKTNDLNRTNGVSTLDIAIIQSHILSATLFTSPYQWIAADVNRSGSVTSLDILLIRRLILGLNSSFNGNSVWTFVDTSAAGFDPLMPLQYRDSIVLNDLLTDKFNLNFVAVKLGDVNFDYNNTVARPQSPGKPVVLYHDDILASKEETIRIPVKVKDFKNVLGAQFTLGFNPAALVFEGVENNRLNMSFASNRSSEGKLGFIWNDAQNRLATLNDGDVLMELLFKTNQLFTEEDITINSDITEAELWDGDYKKHAIIKGSGKLIFKRHVDFTSESFDVTPNPSEGPLQIKLRLLLDKNIRIDLLDIGGRIVFTQEQTGAKGINTINIDLQKKQPLAPGIYYLRLTGINGDVESKKIVLVK
jgi:PKD repeat protein